MEVILSVAAGKIIAVIERCSLHGYHCVSLKMGPKYLSIPMGKIPSGERLQFAIENGPIKNGDFPLLC